MAIKFRTKPACAGSHLESRIWNCHSAAISLPTLMKVAWQAHSHMGVSLGALSRSSSPNYFKSIRLRSRHCQQVCDPIFRSICSAYDSSPCPCVQDSLVRHVLSTRDSPSVISGIRAGYSTSPRRSRWRARDRGETHPSLNLQVRLFIIHSPRGRHPEDLNRQASQKL